MRHGVYAPCVGDRCACRLGATFGPAAPAPGHMTSKHSFGVSSSRLKPKMVGVDSDRRCAVVVTFKTAYEVSLVGAPKSGRVSAPRVAEQRAT